MFESELSSGMTNTLVNLGERVGELERKENPIASGIGPFEYEVHVDIGGGGDYTIIKDAADYVLATAQNDEYWTIVVHAGSYTEASFALPDNCSMVGVGYVFIFALSISGTYITLGDNCTVRNIAITLNMDPALLDCWAIECAGYLTLENCTILVNRFGGSGSTQPIGVVKTETGDINNCWLRLRVQESGYPGARNIVRFDDPSPLQQSYLRDCTIGFHDDDSIIEETSSTIYVEGHLAWILDCTIQNRESGDSGYDIEAGAGATVYTSGTLYVKSDGTVINLDSGLSGVTSVAMTVPSILSVAGSPITTAGTFVVTLANQSANRVFAGPTTGAVTTPTFRTLVVDDIPELPGSKITGGVITGTGVQWQIAYWNGTSSLTGNTQFAFFNTDGAFFSTLGLPARMMVGGAQDIVDVLGTASGTSAELQIYHDETTVSGQHRAMLSLVTDQEGATDQAIGDVTFSNAAVAGVGIDSRLGMISVKTAGETDRGYMSFWTGSDGVLSEVARFTSAGNTEIYGNLNVSGTITGTLTISDLQTDTSDGSVARLRAYDVDGTAYVTFGTLTAGNAPSFDLSTATTMGTHYIYHSTGTDVPISDGGTGASTAADARANLELIAGEAGDIWVLRAGDTMTGNLSIVRALTASLTVNSTGSAANLILQSDTANANLNFNAAGQAQLNWQKVVAGTPSARWLALMTSTAESGSNVGSNWQLLRRTDAGASLGQPVFAIERATGFIGVHRAEATAAYTVDVLGTFRVEETTGGVATLARNDTTVNINDVIGRVEFYGNDTQLTTQNYFGNIEVQAQAAISTDAAFGKMLLRTTGPGVATSPVERLALGCVKALTDAATSLFDVTLNAGEMAGGTVVWTIIASDGTNHQAYSGIVTYAVVNKAGTYTSQITHDAANDSKAVSSGTLTAAWTVLNGTNKVTIRVTPTGSLTETIYQIIYSAHSNSPQSIIIL